MRVMRGHGRWLLAGVLLIALPAAGSALLDPTRPPSPGRGLSDAPGGSTGGWRLDSTLVAPDRRVAVINGKQVSEGETVDGARVIDIHQLEVLIQAPGRRMTLQLLPDIVKKQP